MVILLLLWRAEGYHQSAVGHLSPFIHECRTYYLNSRLDYEKLRLKNIPNFIFLCGGEHKRIEADPLIPNSLPQYRSMRGALMDVLHQFPEIGSKVKLAEEYNDWLNHGVVGNLIELELAIADMAGSIVLFLEGPGAYAELGSFCTNEYISQKLILIVNENINQDTEETYINLGPIKYLTDNNKIVLRYSWDIQYNVIGFKRDKIKTIISSGHTETIDKIKLIASRISEETQRISVAAPKVDVSKIGHICFIIADLIKTFHALKISEIHHLISSHFLKDEKPLKFTRTCLYILKNFNFISEVNYGDKYYVSTENNNGFIKYYFSEDPQKIIGIKTTSILSSTLLNN